MSVAKIFSIDFIHITHIKFAESNNYEQPGTSRNGHRQPERQAVIFREKNLAILSFFAHSECENRENCVIDPGRMYTVTASYTKEKNKTQRPENTPLKAFKP